MDSGASAFSTSCQLERFNFVFFSVVAVGASYLFVRDDLTGSPSGISVLLEWLSLIVVAAFLTLQRSLGPNWLRVPLAIVTVVVIFRAVIDTQPNEQWSMYWFGFGARVALAATFMVTLIVAVLFGHYRLFASSRQRLDKSVRFLLSASGWIVIIWALPSLLQPMDSWLNIGDATEKVLDEVTGWAVGRIPGVHTSWVTNSFVGLPLAPLSFTSGFGEEKIILVALYINLLILAIPFSMGWIIRQSVPALGRTAAFAIAFVAVTISGSPINTSLFQELSFLARGLLPVVVGALSVRLLARDLRPSRVCVLALTMGGSIAFWNNFEYGFGVLVAIMVLILTVSNRDTRVPRQFGRITLGFAFFSLVVVLPGFALGGNWLGRRLGVFGDVLGGQAAVHSYNNMGSIPEFGLPTICFALGVAGLTLGFNELRGPKASHASSAGAVSSLYFGVWTVISAPYFLNGGGSGVSRTQFLNIQVVILVFSILGILTPRISQAFRMTTSQNPNLTLKMAGVISTFPILLLCSLAISSVIQVPNGLTEWRRVQTPATVNRHVDEWSPDRLDWIRPALIPELIAPFGGVESVGWWFSYGNALQAVTGLENLFGTTGYETTRTTSQLRLACEPLIRSNKKFVISTGASQALMSRCDGVKVVARTAPNDDGLVVFEVERVRVGPDN